MPAIITHHLFGEQSSTLLPNSILTNQEDLYAYLLGNQGPDPLWARILARPSVANACHSLATRMHEGRVVDTLLCLRSAVEHLSNEDKTCGRAFVLGMAAHYLLDSTTHPLIYAQQNELVALDPSLEPSASDVHSLLEADIDSWILWQMRQQTVLEAPCSLALAHTPRIASIAGSLLSQLAWEIYGIDLGAAEYGAAVRNYQLVYRLIDPPARLTPQSLARIETLARPHSHVLALRHSVTQSDECAAANLDHRLWRDPSTGVTSRSSFADLFHDALAAWPTFSRRLVEGDRQRLEAMVAGIDYDGVPSHT